MANDIVKRKIGNAIKGFAGNNLTGSALNLFQTLGYNTDRQAPLVKKSFNFKENLSGKLRHMPYPHTLAASKVDY